MVVTSILVAIGVLAAVLLAEHLHARRVARVAYLAFGPTGRPAHWANAAPMVRAATVTALAWGGTVLFYHDPVSGDERPSREASKHLLVCLDVSPSMLIKDAGPGPEHETRSQWAGKLAGAILDRLDAESTRVTLVAFYTKALPIVRETFDKEVIANALDGLPMYVAFEPGATDLYGGVTEALDIARVWPSGSAVLVVISDGDAKATGSALRIPDAISDSIVIGVGDPHRSTPINGHSSRQDAASLQQLAARLGGIYHNGARKHLPSDIMAGLTVTSPDSAHRLGWRTLALMAIGGGGFTLALLQPALILFGIDRSYRRARAPVSRPAQAQPGALVSAQPAEVSG